MSKLRKSILSIVLTVLLLLGCTFVASATEAVFENQYVDSNTYQVVTGAYKETMTETATVHVTNIYTAEGGPSMYQRIYAMATSTGTPDVALKGQYKELRIPPVSQYAGLWVSLYAKGFTPWLDCVIDGYWFVH